MCGLEKMECEKVVDNLFSTLARKTVMMMDGQRGWQL